MERQSYRHERGVALFLCVFVLLMLAVISFGLMYMADVETSINSNYRTSQQAFFASRAGFEEVRDRLRPSSPNPITPPSALPGSPNGLIYVLNPAGASDAVDPKDPNNKYFDDELCHENFAGLSLPNPGANIPCTTGAPSSAVTSIASTSPYTNTPNALRYKWVRITLKTNSSTPYTVDGSNPNSPANPNTQVCYWGGTQETLVPPGFTTCLQAAAAGMDYSPVYMITSFAIGSRRMTQYEVASISFPPLPAPLMLNGPGATVGSPHSNPFRVNGHDSGPSGYTGPGACTTTQPDHPAIAVWGATTQTDVANSLFRPDRYTGAMPNPPNANGASVEDVQSCPGCNLGTTLTSPQALENLVASITVVASQVLTGPVSNPANLGTDAHPLVTVIQGDLTLSDNTSGAGILVVTGTLTTSGNTSFDGMLLVIGQGVWNSNGGGSGQYNGAVLVAKTRSAPPAATILPTMGSPSVTWMGGGGNGIYYNGCWVNAMNNYGFRIVASREEMY